MQMLNILMIRMFVMLGDETLKNLEQGIKDDVITHNRKQYNKSSAQDVQYSVYK